MYKIEIENKNKRVSVCNMCKAKKDRGMQWDCEIKRWIYKLQKKKSYPHLTKNDLC